jgi:hypothetical protein
VLIIPYLGEFPIRCCIIIIISLLATVPFPVHYILLRAFMACSVDTSTVVADGSMALLFPVIDTSDLRRDAHIVIGDTTTCNTTGSDDPHHRLQIFINSLGIIQRQRQ